MADKTETKKKEVIESKPVTHKARVAPEHKKQPNIKRIFIKPAKTAGTIVRDPKSGVPLKSDGESKPHNTYWVRRLRDESVVLAVEPKKPKEDDKS